MKVILVGAGLHAKAVVEALAAQGHEIACYADPQPCAWLDAPHLASDRPPADSGAEGFVLGIGGTTPRTLRHRLDLFAQYLAAGLAAPAIVHPAAHVSASARLGAGAIVLARAVVQPDAHIGRAAIVNTGAIVEHDSVVDDGGHVAPAATVLGACRVGACAMIGAGAVVLPATEIAEGALVKALTRHPR